VKNHDLNQLINILFLLFISVIFLLASTLRILETNKAISRKDFSRRPKSCLVLILFLNGIFIIGIVIIVAYFLVNAYR
jgi:hypothetical protein